jgi:hypothetical protein
LLELSDIQPGKEVYNIKTGNKYIIQGTLFHSEPPNDLLVRYTDNKEKEWARPIGLFLLKFSIEKPVKMPYIPDGLVRPLTY